jgi:hypothetical protein
MNFRFNRADSGQEMLKEKMVILDRIRNDNPEVNDDLYLRIRKALKYEFRAQDDKSDLLEVLPTKLKIDLSYIILKNLVSKIPFFKKRDKYFVVYVTQLLRPMKILKGGYIYESGEPADNIYFLIKGSAAFVLHDFQDAPFLLFEEGKLVL